MSTKRQNSYRRTANWQPAIADSWLELVADRQLVARYELADLAQRWRRLHHLAVLAAADLALAELLALAEFAVVEQLELPCLVVALR